MHIFVIIVVVSAQIFSPYFIELFTFHIDFWEFIGHFGYKYFIAYMIWKCFLSVCSLFFHYINVIFSEQTS